MKKLSSAVRLIALLVATTSGKAQPAYPHFSEVSVYSCEIIHDEILSGFELELNLLAIQHFSHLPRRAKITFSDGSVYAGTFHSKVIEDRTRLAGFDRLKIIATGEHGSLSLSLVDTYYDLFGSGIINTEGVEKTILVGCDKSLMSGLAGVPQ